MSRIQIIDATDVNLTLLREINSKLFPLVHYNYFFYVSILDADDTLAKIIYYNGNVAGAVTARPDTSLNKLRCFHILTLGILPPYKRLGLGRMLMNNVISYASDVKFDSIILHVQVNNAVAIQFYDSFGFEIRETIKDYYRTLKPAAAHLLQLSLRNRRKNRGGAK